MWSIMFQIDCQPRLFFLLFFIGFIYSIVIEKAEAGFLQNVYLDTSYNDIDNDIDDIYKEFDADIKIPGRHFPKLPYIRHYREESRTLPLKYSEEIPSVMHTSRGDILSKRIRHEDNFLNDGIENIPQGNGGAPPPNGPYFDRSLPRNLTVQTGKTAVLSCRVINRDEKTVSWIRLHDLHILTVDKYKYSTDQRVSVVYNEANKEWVLRILGAKHSDAGRYECQVSTKPVLSYIVTLNIVVPRAHIVNSPDIYVHRGSLINLTCVVNHGTDQPVFIYWQHYNKLVDIEDKRREVEMSTNMRGKTVSHLLVHKATFEDSGKYTCKPSNGEDATATLHILHGELQQAAMQTNKSALNLASLITIGTLLLLIPLLKTFPSCSNSPG